jgi:hypothetical protein
VRFSRPVCMPAQKSVVGGNQRGEQTRDTAFAAPAGRGRRPAPRSKIARASNYSGRAHHGVRRAMAQGSQDRRGDGSSLRRRDDRGASREDARPVGPVRVRPGPARALARTSRNFREQTHARPPEGVRVTSQGRPPRTAHHAPLACTPGAENVTQAPSSRRGGLGRRAGDARVVH